MAKVIIEICPAEPRTSACLTDGREVKKNREVREALADCAKSGDAQEACAYVLRHIGVEFRIVAINPATGKHENRLATDEEKTATARAIYFESETDFEDREEAEIYLVWSAANEEF